MKQLFIILLFIVFNHSILFSQNQIWVNRINGTANLNDASFNVAVDNAGNIISGGYETLNSPEGYFLNGKLVKYSPSGNLIWSINLEGGKIFDLKVDQADNIYTVMSGIQLNAELNNSSEAYIITSKISSAGTILWSSYYSASAPSSVAIDKSGNIITFGLKNYVFTVIKYTSSGSLLWSSDLGIGSSSNYTSEVVTDDSNNVYICGENPGFSTMKLDSNGILKWAKNYAFGPYLNAAFSMKADKGGNVYVTGGSNQHITTIKYNRNGDQVWLRSLAGPGDDSDYGFKLKLDDSANVYIAGSVWINLTNRQDIVAIKYDSTGQLRWSKTYNGPSSKDDYGFDLAIDSLYNVYVTGITTNSSTTTDIATIKYSASGNQLWSSIYNGTGNNTDIPHSIAIDRSNGVYIAGESKGMTNNLDFVTIKYSSVTGINDLWLSIPDKFVLLQNYPNPFNPTTNIKYSIPFGTAHDLFVQLKVYDVNGKEIETLVNENQIAGSYSVSFNAANYPSGVYFYKLDAGNFSETRKMLLVK